MRELSQATIWPSIRKTNAATSALVKWAKLAVGFSVGGVVACSFFYALHASRIASRQTAFEAAFVRTNRAFVDAMLHEVAASQASLALHTPQTSCWLRRVFNGGCVAMRQTHSRAAAARYAWTVAAATRSSSAVAWAVRAAASVWRVAKEALQRGTSAAASLIGGRMAAKVAAMQLQPVQ